MIPTALFAFLRSPASDAANYICGQGLFFLAQGTCTVRFVEFLVLLLVCVPSVTGLGHSTLNPHNDDDSDGFLPLYFSLFI